MLPPEGQMRDEDKDLEIRRRAYALWEQEGRPDGCAEDHWRRAEAEVGGAIGSVKGRSRPAAGKVEAKTAARGAN